MFVPSLQPASFGRLAVRKRVGIAWRVAVRLSEQHQAWVLRSDAGDVPPRQRNNMHRFKPRRPQRRAVAARALGIPASATAELRCAPPDVTNPADWRQPISCCRGARVAGASPGRAQWKFHDCSF